MSQSDTSKKQPRLFGTFGGVFTPAILTILGVIMFLRAGYITGQAGIRNTLLILLMAETIVLATAISMAAIATNMPVKGGGAYYLISRVLGAQFGSAIGLALYMAQALSVPFYILGFTQSVVFIFPATQAYFQPMALGVAVILFVIVYTSATWAIRAQYVVMTVLGLAIAAFLSGAALNFQPEIFVANWAAAYTEPKMNFWVVFAIFFPAVTGIMAGINMSGNLRDPARALVRGTFAAIFVGGLVYLAEILLCGGAQTRAELITDPFGTLVRQAPLGTGFIVIAGVFAATISSAIGSFLTAPRVLQALARDKIVPGLKPFSYGIAEPRAAILLTLFLTLTLIATVSGTDSLRAFDTVATTVTMLFLLTYGMINMAAFIESFGANPSFRPRFKLYHWSTALLGALACVVVMMLIDPIAALAAGVIIAGIYLLVSRRVYLAAFGDARRGFVYNIITRNLLRLQSMRTDAKNWRPSFLVMSGNPHTRPTLLQYAAWLEAQRGLITAAEIIIGNLREKAKLRDATQSAMTKIFETNKFKVFPETIIAEDLDEGIRVLTQAHSLGPIKPNTVLFGWPKDPQRIESFVRHLQDIALIGKSLICVIDKGLPDSEWQCHKWQCHESQSHESQCHESQSHESQSHESQSDKLPEQDERCIDIWWRGQCNGSLMLIMAYLLTRNWEWNDARIRVLRQIDDIAGREPSQKALTDLIQAARIDAEALVVVSTEPFPVVLRRHSQNADVVFMGFEIPGDDQAVYFHKNFSDMSAGMPTMLLMHSSGEADFQA